MDNPRFWPCFGLALLVAFHVTLKSNAVPCLAPNAYGLLELRVKGQPFLMIAGEMHNSSATSVRYLDEEVWPAFCELKANTALAAIGWDQIEPEEGRIDFSCLDNVVQGARQNKMKLVLLWFGAWKNGHSQYVPAWVKTDARRFARVTDGAGNVSETLSPACAALLDAERRTFTMLIEHLKAIDRESETVLMVQIENEVGYDCLRDESAPSRQQRTCAPEKARNDDVRFAAWQFATYINALAKAGRKVYDIPFFVNAWLDAPGQKPGEYPNGGPVPGVMDIWQQYAPDVCILAPDIYGNDFAERCRVYGQRGNPLFIPESKADLSCAFWAFGSGSAIGFAPFGFEGLRGDVQFAAGYGVLRSVQDEILAARGSERIRALWAPGKEPAEFEWTNGAWRVRFVPRDKSACGLVIRTGEDAFTLAGKGYGATFSCQDAASAPCMLEVREFDEQGFRRILNGDEVMEWGMCVFPGIQRRTREYSGDYRAGGASLYVAEAYKRELYPGILRVKLGRRSRSQAVVFNTSNCPTSEIPSRSGVLAGSDE